MSSMNKFCMMGRLVNDPEIKETENGNKVANIRLAVDREYKDKEGKKITDFFNFSLWNKDAERIKAYSKKGAIILLEGTFSNKKDLETGKQINDFNPVITKYQHLSNVNRIDKEVSDAKETDMER